MGVVARTEKGQNVNRTGLSDIFGVALNTIDAWVKRGCPVVQKGAGRGQEWTFNTAQVSKWLREQAVAEFKGDAPANDDTLKTRKLLAETEKAELELAKAKGDVALVKDFERVQALAMGAIRANVMNVPQRAVLQLLGETDETIFKQKLKAELALALETAAATELTLDDEELIDE